MHIRERICLHCVAKEEYIRKVDRILLDLAEIQKSSLLEADMYLTV